MPLRTVPLITGQYYHVFNRGINKQPIFLKRREYKRALEAFQFYSFATQKLRLSKFFLLSQTERERLWIQMINANNKLVDILCFCLMPNHFHFLLEQKIDDGISKFMGDFQNSYTRYFNTSHRGIGPLLQGQFKAVRIEDDEQLLHLSRYIHLNPYTSFIVKELEDLLDYPWSSFPEYLSKIETGICKKAQILSQFPNTEAYRSFVFDQANYQRELEKIKHLSLEE